MLSFVMVPLLARYGGRGEQTDLNNAHGRSSHPWPRSRGHLCSFFKYELLLNAWYLLLMRLAYAAALFAASSALPSSVAQRGQD